MAVQTDFSRLRLMIQSAHSTLGTAWPRPGSTALACAAKFINTNLFTTLENASFELDKIFDELEKSKLRPDLVVLWRRVREVITRLKALGRGTRNSSVDRAFNLLYLATGILYQEITNEFAPGEGQDERFSTVRNIPELLSVCAWHADGNLFAALSEDLFEVSRTLVSPPDLSAT